MIKREYISRRFDEVAILATLMKLATPDPDLIESDYAVLAALRRSSDAWDLPVPQVADKLASYNEDQVFGLVNNVKGILHEMEFQRLENEDGDAVVAALFPDTNHKMVDVQLLDETSGNVWEVQLKATNDFSAISSWLDANPDTELLVTEELADQMGIPSSGLSNDELTVRVEDFVDRMMELNTSADESLWDYFPTLAAASIGIVVFELWRRYRAGLIPFDKFKVLAVRTLGIKAAKYAAIFSALAVPGLNVLVGTYLLGSLIFATGKLVAKTPSFKPFAFLASKKKRGFA